MSTTAEDSNNDQTSAQIKIKIDELAGRPLLQDSGHRESLAWQIQQCRIQERRVDSYCWWHFIGIAGLLVFGIFAYLRDVPTGLLSCAVILAIGFVIYFLWDLFNFVRHNRKVYKVACGELENAQDIYRKAVDGVRENEAPTASLGDDLERAFSNLSDSLKLAIEKIEKSSWGNPSRRQARRDAFVERIGSRLEDRRELLSGALNVEKKNLSEDGAVVLQSRESDSAWRSDSSQASTFHGTTDATATGAPRSGGPSQSIPQFSAKDIREAVDYRLAITDLFVEKAQYHLEARADRYEWLGYTMYVFAVVMFLGAAAAAVLRMELHDPRGLVAWVGESLRVTKASDGSSGSAQGDAPDKTSTKSEDLPITLRSDTDKWIDLLQNFIRSFTAYGLVILAGVVLTRGARACLDQRERLLSKRHSLRQGRLYLHLSGGRVSVSDLEHAFNWNHEQRNAFTNMNTEAKAPFGAVLDELVKVIPELIRIGESSKKRHVEAEPTAR